MLERAFKLRERDIFADRQPFDLEKFRFVRHVGRFVAKHFARHDDAIRRIEALFHLRFHVAHLDRGRVRAQNVSRLIFDEKGILHVARGMVFGDIEGVEVVPLVLDERAFREGEAHFKKYAVCLADERGDRMYMAAIIGHVSSIP